MKENQTSLEAVLRKIIREEIEACLSRLNSRERLLDAKQASELLSCSEDWLYRHAKSLPFFRRIGRMVRFSERGILAYLESKKSLS